MTQQLPLPSFFQWCAQLELEKHTGATLVHWAGGVPRMVEIIPPSLRIVLDNERRHGQA